MKSYSYFASKDGDGVYVKRGPWWAFLLEKFDYVCDRVPAIPLPALPIKVYEYKLVGGKVVKCESGSSTLKEEYGNLHSWFHFFVCSKILCHAWDRIKEFRIKFADEEQKQEFINFEGKKAEDFYNTFEEQE